MTNPSGSAPARAPACSSSSSIAARMSSPCRRIQSTWCMCRRAEVSSACSLRGCAWLLLAMRTSSLSQLPTSMRPLSMRDDACASRERASIDSRSTPSQGRGAGSTARAPSGFSSSENARRGFEYLLMRPTAACPRSTLAATCGIPLRGGARSRRQKTAQSVRKWLRGARKRLQGALHAGAARRGQLPRACSRGGAAGAPPGRLLLTHPHHRSARRDLARAGGLGFWRK